MPVRIRAILLILTFLAFVSVPITGINAEVTALNVSPAVIVQGEQLSISGVAAPDEEVWLNSSFELVIPVVDGNYTREFKDVYFPTGKKSFTITVSNIKNIRVAFYFIYRWFEFSPLNATNGIATLSVSFPPGIAIPGLGNITDISGKQTFMVYGEALDGATSVNLDFTMSIAVMADSEGYFELNLPTTGVPVGEYIFSADGLTQTVPVIAPPPPTLDTRAGTYPSNSGVHNGSITPTMTLNVSTLYTYPCPGTGGHSEYAALSYPNGTVIAEAYWDGYVGDWHNLTFNRSFTLYANEPYHYTIHTGSYPQIIHNQSFNATGGVITCTSFEDANGKVYYDWIPAIKLFGRGNNE
ncbi:MAG: hypothetical protein JW945_05615 [Methanomicrobia archaeon]|nr:hypothetical protein [Methanomicrobia archaeon]